MKLRNRRDWEAMPKMCGLEAPGEDPVYVNPLNVLLLRPWKDKRGIGTTIVLTGGETAPVRLPLTQVAKLLDIAMNADQA